MPSLSEILGSQPVGNQFSTPLHDALASGTATLSGNEEVLFVPYVRRVLPIDGWVFWVNATLLTPTQLSTTGLHSPGPIAVQGSLHYASVGSQADDENIIVRKVDFTSMTALPALAEIAPDVLYVATWKSATAADGTPLGPFRFTFSNRNAFYEEAGISHYVGDAVYPVFDQMLIESWQDFDTRQVVSNSLPIWLAMSTDVPFPALTPVSIQMFPAFLVADNQPAPYGAVEIPPGSLRALQPTPYLASDGSHWQLVQERVRFSLYGLRNDEALALQDYIIQYSVLTDLFGLADMPTVRDEHRAQVELAVLAQRKVIEFTCNYYQTSARRLARQLIESAGLATGGFAFNPAPLKFFPTPQFNA